MLSPLVSRRFSVYVVKLPLYHFLRLVLQDNRLTLGGSHVSLLSRTHLADDDDVLKESSPAAFSR